MTAELHSQGLPPSDGDDHDRHDRFHDRLPIPWPSPAVPLVPSPESPHERDQRRTSRREVAATSPTSAVQWSPLERKLHRFSEFNWCVFCPFSAPLLHWLPGVMTCSSTWLPKPTLYQDRSLCIIIFKIKIPACVNHVNSIPLAFNSSSSQCSQKYRLWGL